MRNIVQNGNNAVKPQTIESFVQMGNCMYKKNFTLIELLVVIGVIVILTGILLPALSSSRNRAKRIQDLSNMKQVGTGLHAYSDAYKECMPCYDVYRGLWSQPDGPRATAYFTGANAAWKYDRRMGLGLLFSDGYITNPKVFFCTEPHSYEGSLYTYDNPDSVWANWNQSGKKVQLSTSTPMVLVNKGDLSAVKAYLASSRTPFDPCLGEGPISNILSDNTSKVVLACFALEYRTAGYNSADAKPPHGGAGVNIVFGDNSGRWQKIDWSNPDAPDKTSSSGDYFFGWLNVHANR